LRYVIYYYKSSLKEKSHNFDRQLDCRPRHGDGYLATPSKAT
jgi:hypothetical protein